ncbi:xylulokinase [Spirillospora sp. CA-253888]
MALVAGIDSSTQSCKVVVRDADTGAPVRTGSAPHPPGTEVDPEHWWSALLAAVEDAGGLADVAALAVGGQQHGMVCLDGDGRVIRPALLWNDVRSADAAAELVAELGGGDPGLGARAWTDAVGTVPVASLTVTKLRWLADHEPDNAARVAAVALPHDWLTWRLCGATGLEALVTDRSDASGTGYFDASSGTYRRDLLARALRRTTEQAAAITLPRVLDPNAAAGRGADGLGLGHVLLAPGCGDNAAAALALDLRPGRVSVSLGTSGVVAAPSARPFRDPTGQVAGFADATGRHLGLAVTLNAARILDAAAAVLGTDHAELSRLALAAEPGAGGLVHVPYLDGERTPNLPRATGSLLGMTTASLTRENYARAAVEGLLCLMADGIAATARLGVAADGVVLIGGAARSEAVRRIAPQILGVPVEVPAASEYVADGAARQAAWVLASGEAPPRWAAGSGETFTAAPRPEILSRYREAVGRLFPGVAAWAEPRST